jgi:hypothetical protein
MPTPSVVTSDVQSKNPEKPNNKCFDITSPNAVTVLAGRNVDFKSRVDEDRKWIESTMLSKSRKSCSVREEQNWRTDLSKSAISDEAIFQRTIMMDLINRHQLADTLDYTCESRWTCPSSMPHKNPELAKKMPKPKPDLAVAFQADCLLPVFQQTDLDSLRSIMCPESSGEVKRDRAFHFLSIEVKKAKGQLDSWVAHRQNFNTATQALHNIWYFMDLAGKESLEIFYKKVRFYSVVATPGSFHVRVHRAIELEKGRIEKDYPLAFVYDVLHNHQAETYTKAEATGIIRNILIEYGVKTLQPILKKTLEKVWENFQPEPRGLLDEAEEQRSRGRAASRQTQEVTELAPPARKTQSVQAPDTSFTRNNFSNLNVNSPSCLPSEKA